MLCPVKILAYLHLIGLVRRAQSHARPLTRTSRRQVLAKAGRIWVCFRRKRRRGSPMAVIIRTPRMIAIASRRVCIAPSETSNVVAKAAGWLALRIRLINVVSTAATTTAQTRVVVTTPVASTLGAAHARKRYKVRKPAPRPTRCPTIILYGLALRICGCSTSS